MWLPRRRARSVHGRLRPRGDRPRHRRGQGRPARARHPALPRARLRGGAAARARLRVACASRPTPRRSARRSCTSSRSARPQRGGSYAADLSQVDTAVAFLLEHARSRTTARSVVVGKSTVPVGTAQSIADRLTDAGLDAVVVWNPEFLREGYAVADTTRPDRVVYGLPEDEDRGELGRAALDEVYRPIIEAGTPRLLVNYPTAELVKVAANSFLATKISFINSMAELCDATGRRRHPARRGDRPRRPHRTQVPPGRHRLRRWLPAQGHPRLHGPRRRARRRPVADLPARGRLDQHAPPRPRRRARGADVRRPPRRRSRWPCSA